MCKENVNSLFFNSNLIFFTNPHPLDSGGGGTQLYFSLVFSLLTLIGLSVDDSNKMLSPLAFHLHAHYISFPGPL